MTAVIKKLMPLLDRVLVKKIEGPTRTKGGLMMPSRVLVKMIEGEVIAVGPGARSERGELVPVLLKVGDHVVLPEHGGVKVTMEDDREYLLFKEAEILAKIHPETDPEKQPQPILEHAQTE